MAAYPVLEPQMTFEEIGAAMGITRQRAQQIFDRGISKLRANGMEPALALVAELHQDRQYAIPKFSGRAGRQ